MNTVQPIRDKEKIYEIRNILKAKNERDYILFSVGINTGLRISDILNLTVKNVRGTHINIREIKTNKEIRRLITRPLRRDLKGYIKDMEDDEYLIKSQKGRNKSITRVTAYKILRDVAKKVGLSEIGTHTLRKTFGYHYYKQHKDVAELMKMFNHFDQETTLRYIGFNQELQDRSMRNFGL